MIHRGDWEDIVPNWSGYSDWKSIVVLDEDLKTIKRIRK